MTAPQPDDPPLTGASCLSWAQAHELPSDSQSLHTLDTWCSILALATDILWAASDRRWRNVLASETATPESPPSACVTRHGYAFDHRVTAPWAGDDPVRVRLPRPDVTAITAAEIGGVPFAAYRRAGNYAVRTDGRGWPMVTTTLITYDFGRLVPHSGKLAAIILAGELGKAFAGKACALPARVTSVTRQGLSFDMLESLEVLKEGLTGLYAVDQWIMATNQSRRGQVGQVWSPDIAEARRA
ncbi:MAG: hypothetical protein ACRDTT_03210 [Pseudonocardiaceae bacterium]